jgi:hypothetical protein
MEVPRMITFSSLGTISEHAFHIQAASCLILYTLRPILGGICLGCIDSRESINRNVVNNSS